MILKQIKISNYGPFYSSVYIDFEENVTVLTGANDTGKSSILKLINSMFTDKIITEEDANINWLSETDMAWKKSQNLNCNVKFKVTELTKNYINDPDKKLNNREYFTAKFYLSPGRANQKVELFRDKDSGILINSQFIRMPKILLKIKMILILVSR